MYLHVDVGPVVDQELQTQRSVSGRSSEVQRREALVVGLTHVSSVIDELTDNSILSVKTRHVQRRVPKRIRLIDLLSQKIRLVILGRGKV